ncbi:organic cation transporter protein-like [Oratosquilla oratoria]|uniref:organic cation transporter protein-like n=1 Tax=Oratosquilla oratoria TaxID=337810 RepID=UPI003F76F8B7
MSMKFDDLLTQLRTGRWNLLYFAVLSYAWAIIVPHAFSGPFVSPPLTTTCTKPDIDFFRRRFPENLETVTHVRPRNKCEMTAYGSGGMHIVATCTEWSYDNSTFTSTITSEYDLVCGQAFQRVIYQDIVVWGIFIGDPLCGVLFDIYGRRNPLRISFALFSVVTLGSCWLSYLTSIQASRFLLGILMPMASHGLYTFAMEVCEPKYRSLVGIAVAIPYALWFTVWGGLAYLIRDWRWLMFVASLPCFPLLAILLFLDESPRWLIVKGRYEEAVEVLEKAARWNGSTLPPRKNLLDILGEIASENSSPVREPEGGASVVRKGRLANMIDTIAVLYRTPKQRKITLVLHLSFLCVVSMHGDEGTIISMNTFQYMAFTGLLKLLAYVLTVPIIVKFGRKYPLLVGYGTCAVSLCVVPFIPSGLTWLITPLLVLSNLIISAMFQILFLYSVELLPTEVRARGLGMSLLVSRIVLVLTLYIGSDLRKAYHWMPSVTCGMLSIIAAIATMSLPDTLNRPLFETVSALEHENKIKGLRQVYYKHPGTIIIEDTDQTSSPNMSVPKCTNTSQGDVPEEL